LAAPDGEAHAVDGSHDSLGTSEQATPDGEVLDEVTDLEEDVPGSLPRRRGAPRALARDRRARSPRLAAHRYPDAPLRLVGLRRPRSPVGKRPRSPVGKPACRHGVGRSSLDRLRRRPGSGSITGRPRGGPPPAPLSRVPAGWFATRLGRPGARIPNTRPADRPGRPGEAGAAPRRSGPRGRR